VTARARWPRSGSAPGYAWAALAVSAALTLAACTAGSDEPTAGTAFVTPAPPGGSALPHADDRGAATSAEEATAADVAFLAAMVVHHEQAVELADLAASRADDEELADLASRMRVTQAAEADAMRSWLAKRSADDAATDHGHDAVMRGEISRSTLDRAAELDGPAFDELFLAAMVPHHRGAVDMAEARLAEAGDPAVARWARAIATAQSLEIERMLEIEARLAGAG
jgi:uncharacterized protein (DUF305 family)